MHLWLLICRVPFVDHCNLDIVSRKIVSGAYLLYYSLLCSNVYYARPIRHVNVTFLVDRHGFAEQLSSLLWSVSLNPHNSLTLWDIWIKGVRALRDYFGPPMRSKNRSCSSLVSSY